MAVFGHRQPIPRSEVAFPLIQRKSSNAVENWGGPSGGDLNLLLGGIYSSPLGLGWYIFAFFW